MLSSQTSRPSPSVSPARKPVWLWVGLIALVAAGALIGVLVFAPGPKGANGQPRDLAGAGAGLTGQPAGNAAGSPTPGTPGLTGAPNQGAAPMPAGNVAASQPANAVLLPSPTNDALRRGISMVEQGKYIEGRAELSALLTTATDLTARDAQAIRDTLSSINEELVFGPKVAPGDPLAEIYTVQNGDYLSKIAPKYRVTYQAIELINKTDARRIRPGQKLKMIKGPFLAVVTKSAYRLDLFLTGAGKPIYIRSFDVGLGEGDSTPIGSWVINSKLANPAWTNPRTGKMYAADDPQNPIGEYWMGLQGFDDRARGKGGYGIHGTVDPDSIGRQASMGCVRMRDADVALLHKLLVERYSTVAIEP